MWHIITLITLEVLSIIWDVSYSVKGVNWCSRNTEMERYFFHCFSPYCLWAFTFQHPFVVHQTAVFAIAYLFPWHDQFISSIFFALWWTFCLHVNIGPTISVRIWALTRRFWERFLKQVVWKMKSLDRSCLQQLSALYRQLLLRVN